VRAWLQEGKLTAGHGRALLAFSGAEQVKRARALLESSLSVREAERAARPARPARIHDADTRAFLDEMRALTGMRAALRGGTRKGVVEFRYVNRDDLNNLMELLRRGKQG
ncbi:MAG TPA: chromosome partitioning protein ParB, partial [Fibrobacteria bacterium]|nr:chromosome partitioning protein ParB [Fibrobacteria bacterium]